MKKKIVIVLMVITTCILLCACGGKCYVCERRVATKTWAGYPVCEKCYNQLLINYSNSISEAETARENAEKYLVIKTSPITTNSAYTICEGTITNKGDDTYYFIQLKVSFKDKGGNVIDTDTTYACGNEGLAPGESTKFRASVDKDYDIKSVSVKVYDFDIE